MWRYSFFYAEVCSQPVPTPLVWGPASVPDVLSGQSAQWCWEVCIQLWVLLKPGLSALPLLVPRIGADHHDPPVPADHPALVADRLDARVHLHGFAILFSRLC
ncbi:hypothetical protein EB73_35865 [Mycobacterium sp. SWH-M3]|nr:hypothetical protein EB73_35865 [Mycobacterium sp. SWH-M3]